MVMYVKRLEAGRFKLPEYDENTQSYQIVAGSCSNGGGHTRVSRPATQAPSCTTKRVCGIGKNPLYIYYWLLAIYSTKYSFFSDILCTFALYL